MPISKDLIKSLNKKHGDAIFNILSNNIHAPVGSISSGSLSFDYESGIGGIPRGRVTELFGPESSGKTTLCQHIISKAQAMGLNVGFVDTEQSFDVEYAKICGVKFDDSFGFSQPDSLESGLDVVEDLISSGEIGLVIFDSLVGVSPKKELEDDLGDANVSLISKIVTQFGRRNIYKIRETNTAVIFTNQARDKIGSYYPVIETTGGHALKHYASMRVLLTRTKEIKEDDAIIGVEYRAQFKKNKVANPHGNAKFSIYFGKGIWAAEDVLTNALEYGILAMRGSYVTYNGESLAQGKLSAIDLLDRDGDLRDRISKELLNTLGVENAT